MPKFKYVATDPTGVRVSGVMSAASAVRVRNELSSREFRNVQIRERKRLSQIEITTKKLKPVDLMNFSRQFAAFLRAGIPILDALHALAEEASNPQLKDVLVDISDALRSGDTLSNAMAVHSEIFPSYYIGILRSAELTGNLDSVLTQLASYIERDLAAKRAVKSALTYPTGHHGDGGGHGARARRLRAPEVRGLLRRLRRRAPVRDPPAVEHVAVHREHVGVPRPRRRSSLALVLFLYLRSASGRMWRDKTLLRLPAIGAVVRYAVIERFFRILGSMLRAGVPVPDALRSATEATNNLAYQRALTQAPRRSSVVRGCRSRSPRPVCSRAPQGRCCGWARSRARSTNSSSSRPTTTRESSTSG